MARASSDPVHVRVTCTSPVHTCPDEVLTVLDDDKEQRMMHLLQLYMDFFLNLHRFNILYLVIQYSLERD